MDLLVLSRSAADTVTARFRLTSESPDALKLVYSLGYLTDAKSDVNGISLVDAVGGKLYFPITTKTGECLCSAQVTATVLKPDSPLDFYAVFPAPPATVKRVTVRAPLTVPFQDVPIAEGPAAPSSAEIDPASADLAAPTIRSMVNTVDSDDEATDDDAVDRTVRLSADVLFAVDKSVLSPNARAVLQRLAGQIDASTGSTVKIDGHTDSTGGDAHNQPLSEQRARAVEDLLKSLVTRKGITFQSAGHGSTQPVAENTAESGRRLNRRVAVTFARPIPTPTASPQPGTGNAFQWTGKETPAIASARPKSPPGSNWPLSTMGSMFYEINSIHRDSSDLVTLVWTLTNKGTQQVNVAVPFAKYLDLQYKDVSTSGLTLIDPTTKLNYRPLRDQNGVCLCYQSFLAGKSQLKAGEQVTFSSLYKVPGSVTKIDLQIPFYEASTTIPGLTIN
jgi:outer membrane protein OmpA-like peptidoglycan-associated protein